MMARTFKRAQRLFLAIFLSEVVDIRPHTIQVQLVQDYLLSCQNEAANPSYVINSLFGIRCSGKSNEG